MFWDYIGKTVEFDEAPAYFQNSNIVWLKHDQTQVTNRYLQQCFARNPWNVDNGCTITRLYASNIAQTEIPVPPLEAQERLVEVLDNFEKICADQIQSY